MCIRDRVRSSQTKSFDAGEDVICGLGPHERLGAVVVEVQIVPDGLFELPGRAMRATPDVVLSQRCEPALDLIEPRRRGRSEVDVESRIAGKPGPVSYTHLRAHET